MKKDAFLIAALLLLAVLCGFYGAGDRIREALGDDSQTGGMEASVSLEGREVLRLGLPEEEEAEAEILFLDPDYVKEEQGTFWIYRKGCAALDAGYNEIRIEKNGVRCSAADCPDLVCVRTGTIQRETEMIACLPHRMSVQLFRAS